MHSEQQVNYFILDECVFLVLHTCLSNVCIHVCHYFACMCSTTLHACVSLIISMYMCHYIACMCVTILHECVCMCVTILHACVCTCITILHASVSQYCMHVCYYFTFTFCKPMCQLWGAYFWNFVLTVIVVVVSRELMKNWRCLL